MSTYAADVFLTPYELDATNNQFRIIEDPAGAARITTVALDPGDYYSHDDTTLHTTFKGLFYSIVTLLNSGTTAGVGTRSGSVPLNTYSWQVRDPTASTGLSNNGLAIVAAAAVDDFEVNWGHSNPVDARLFGNPFDFPPGNDASVTAGPDEEYVWPFATLHRMVTRNIGDDHATSKLRQYFKLQRASSARRGDAQVITWESAFRRRFFYEDVWGVEVEKERALQPEWQGLTQRGNTDVHAVWWYVWDALTDGETVLAVHDTNGVDLQVDGNDYEAIRLGTDDLEWTSFATPTLPGGDLRNIEFLAWVDPDNSNYEH